MAITLDGTNGIISPDFEPSGSTVPTNGFYLPAANALGLATNSTERLRITSSGYVGIGTSSPGDLLTVGSSATRGIASVIGTASGTPLFKLDNTNASGGHNWGLYAGSTAAATFDIVDFSVGGGTTRLTLDGSGNLGLGVTPSAASLPTIQSTYGLFTGTSEAHIARNAYFSTDWKYVASSTATRFSQAGGQFQWYNAPSGTAGAAITFTQAMTLDASGNLMLGATAASGVLYLQSSTNPAFRMSYGGASALNELAWDSTDFVISADKNNAVSSNLIFKNDGSERARISSSGSLLVGVTSGSTHVLSRGEAGNYSTQVINTTPTSPYGLGIALTGVSGGGGAYFLVCADNANRLLIAGTGNVTNVNNSYGAISDQSIKENIVDATPKLQDLLTVKIRNFNLKGESTKQIGVVAQELEEVFPGMIEESADGLKGVKYSVFVPMLIKAIQELSAKVTALEAK